MVWAESTSMPCFILIDMQPLGNTIHQRCRQTDRRDMTGQRSNSMRTVFGRPVVKRFALCYQTVVCLSCPVCLSLTFVHCGQTVGRIKVKLGVQVGLGPGHIVLDGDPAPILPKGYSPLPIFGPYLLRRNGCMDQDVTCYGARPPPR